jgi:hypothetical protein
VASLLGHDQLGLMARAGRVAHADDELVLQLKRRDGGSSASGAGASSGSHARLKAMADTPEAER